MNDLQPLLEFPRVLSAVMQCVPADALRRRGTRGAFALIEHAWHLADLEVEGYGVRIDALMNGTSAHFADFDGDAIATQRRYIELPLAPALLRFEEARARNVDALARAGDEQCARLATQDGVTGPVSLHRIRDMMIGHDRAHAGELALLSSELGIAVPPSFERWLS